MRSSQSAKRIAASRCTIFIVTLLRDPRFQETVNDIVVEYGNARYQDVADRYSSGDAVSPEQLRPGWPDAVNILVRDAPVYERVSQPFDPSTSVDRRHAGCACFSPTAA
jgi:hypothetical protein